MLYTNPQSSGSCHAQTTFAVDSSFVFDVPYFSDWLGLNGCGGIPKKRGQPDPNKCATRVSMGDSKVALVEQPQHAAPLNMIFIPGGPGAGVRGRLCSPGDDQRRTQSHRVGTSHARHANADHPSRQRYRLRSALRLAASSRRPGQKRFKRGGP